MIPFQPIQLSDREAIDRLLRESQAPICDHTFTNLYAWQPTYQTAWAEVGDALVVRYELGAEEYGYMVVTKRDECLWQAVTELDKHCHEKGEPLHLVCMDGGDLQRFEQWAANEGRQMEQYAICDNRNSQDYIYSVEKLATLSGKKLQPKRNHINKFESRYDYRFEELREVHFKECLRLECIWQRSKSDESDCRETKEQLAIKRILEAYDRLNVMGGVITIDSKVVAFTLGSAISEQCFCTHVEKADATYEGIFPMINKCFANVLLQRGFSLVNREEDMGIEGLRRAKLSYSPYCLQSKLSIKEISTTEQQCRELWIEAFGDEREWIDMFLTEISSPENTFTHSEQGRVVAMVHLVELETELGRTAYLYAIATDSRWRGRGFSTRLIEQAVAAAKERGYDAVAVIPAEEGLVEFYRRRGFGEPSLKIDFSQGMDLGTGDAERDVAMVIRLG